MDITQYVEELKETGITKLSGAYTKEQCRLFVDKCNKILEMRGGAGDLGTKGDTQNIWNFFRHDLDLMPLVVTDAMDDILKTVMDEDYVLIGANIINRQNLATTAGASKYADYWHTDSRYLGGRRLASGFSYSTIIMLDDFTVDNGATHVIPGTHKMRLRPEKQGEYPHEVLTGEAGTMVIMDSGIWHRGGPSGVKSRWGVFNMYGPWFMKPYFNFPVMMGEGFGAVLTPTLRRLFHYNSQPPRDETERTYTLVK